LVDVRVRLIVVLALASGALTSCSSGVSGTSGTSAASGTSVACAQRATGPATTISSPGAPAVHGTPRVLPDHVVLIVMENKESGSVIGSQDAPFLNCLAAGSVLLTDHHAIRHPSLPNYLALTGGSTFGITSDCTDCTLNEPNLADQLERAGLSWGAYMEDMPAPCFTGAFAGRYAKKHDPFVYYRDITSDPSRCRNVVPFTELRPALASNRLPRFAWISPDLCNDTHDCPVGTGDRWLSKQVPAIERALGPTGLLVITWDEGASNAGCCGNAAGGQIATVIAGPGAASGVRIAYPTDHYSILELVDDLFGLPPLGEANGAPDIASSDVLVRPSAGPTAS
jgi:hypothetical protein